MIVFDLVCGSGHRFEGWFESAAAFETQLEADAIACPICASRDVKRALSVPKIGFKKSVHGAAPGNDTSDQSATMNRLRNVLQRQFQNVGSEFAAEARRIHYGEARERPIRGKTTALEAVELIEEGIGVLPVPEWADPERKPN